MRSALVLLGLASACALMACAGDTSVTPPQPPSMVQLDNIVPKTILPRSRVVVSGDNLTDAAKHFLLLAGAVKGKTVDQTISLEVAEGAGHWQVDQATFERFGEGTFSGTAQVISRNDWGEVRSPILALSLRFGRHLKPSITGVGSGVVFLNSRVVVDGTNMLLGGAEGRSSAQLRGCFLQREQPGNCEAVGQIVDRTVVIEAEGDQRRRRGRFSFGPEIAGIQPGRFEGTVTLLNQHPDGKVLKADPIPATFDLEPTILSGFEQKGVSLGQVLHVRGQGFIEGTSLRFEGKFLLEGGRPRDVAFEVVTKLEGEGRASCVVTEEGIGEGPDLRREKGMLEGIWVPVNRHGVDKAEGEAARIDLAILPVKQVVWIRFTDGWEGALKKFGLQGADGSIQQRILEIFKRDYAGINVEARLGDTAPVDFKLYARVDITGRDPNDAGQFGLDATPGKDTDNHRLHDIIGGVNAETQDDGFRGYGGVFAESILGISKHPPAGVHKAWIQADLFDRIFDPVRPDTGVSVSSTEVAAAPKLDSTRDCPAETRPEQVACAVRVLGNLIGTTSTHEFGHSLGLANPYNGSVVDSHNRNDKPNRIMDTGEGRSFRERAELDGEGPAVFCDDSFTYLRKILPGGKIPDTSRPACD